MLPPLQLVAILAVKPAVLPTLLLGLDILIRRIPEPQTLPSPLIMLIAESLSPALRRIKVTLVQRFLIRLIVGLAHLLILNREAVEGLGALLFVGEVEDTGRVIEPLYFHFGVAASQIVILDLVCAHRVSPIEIKCVVQNCGISLDLVWFLPVLQRFDASLEPLNLSQRLGRRLHRLQLLFLDLFIALNILLLFRLFHHFQLLIKSLLSLLNFGDVSLELLDFLELRPLLHLSPHVLLNLGTLLLQGIWRHHSARIKSESLCALQSLLVLSQVLALFNHK